MFPAPLFLILLIIASPIFIIFDGPIVYGLVTASAAILVAIVALRIRAGEAGFLSTVIRWVAIAAVVPVVWMLIQVLPLKLIGLAHPIWESTSTALRQPVMGSVSIDPGDTLISLVRYSSTAAVAFVAAAIAADRRRAEWVLIALMVATTLIASMVLATTAYASFLSDYGRMGNAATDVASLGIIIAVATGLNAVELYKVKPVGQHKPQTWPWLYLVACVIAISICSFAVIVAATSEAYVAVACGLATLAVAFLIRRFNFGPWEYSAIVSIVLVVAIAAIAFKPGTRSVDLTLAFSAHASSPLIEVTQRVLTEASWMGTGAGTFAAVLPIYQDINEMTVGTLAPTAAAAIAVELGRPFFWAVLLAAVALVVTLLRGALLRRRDFLYAATGASCVVASALLALGNAALLSTPVSTIVAVIVGMAIAQSKSRVLDFYQTELK